MSGPSWAQTKVNSSRLKMGGVDYHMVANEATEAQKPIARRRPRADFFSQRLGKRIDELGLSGAEVARRVGISARQLNYYVRGDREPNLTIAKSIASILEIPLDDLIDTKSVSKHRDSKTYAALERFHRVCNDLLPEEVAMLADTAEVAVARRRQDNTRYERMGGSATCGMLMRVHHVLIPAIVRRAGTPKVHTEIVHRDDDKLWAEIDIVFDEPRQRSGLLTEFAGIARNQLGLTKDQVRTHEPDLKLLVLRICLGAAPPPPDPPKSTEKRVRHRARPRSAGL